MKNSKPKIPFSLIVKQAGLDRAARWMPLAGAAFCLLVVGCIVGCAPYAFEYGTSFLDECPVFFSMTSCCVMIFFFAALEFVGSLADLLSACLSLRKARN